MKMKTAALTTLIAALSASLPAVARPLGEELQNLMQVHPLLKAQKLAVEAAQVSKDAAFAGYLPRVNLSADTGNEQITTLSKTPGALPSETDLQRQRVSATVEQNLFAGGRTRAQNRIAAIDMDVQENSLHATTQDILLEGITAYLQVVRYQLLTTLARRNQETTQRQLDLETRRVEGGGGIVVDVLQARSRLQVVRERRVFYEQGLRDAIANYQQVFAHAPDLARIEDLDIFTARLPKSLPEAIQTGQDASTRLKESLLQSQRALRQVDSERSGFLPSIDLVGTLTEEHDANQLDKREEGSLLVKFNWNLYSGGETSNRSKAARLLHQSQVAREEAVRNKVYENIRVSWNQLINGREREELLDSAAGISRDVMLSRKRLRDAGRESAINVLDAEVEYYGVLANKINAATDTKIGSYRLLAAIGALTPESVGLGEGPLQLPVKPLSLNFEGLEVDQ